MRREVKSITWKSLLLLVLLAGSSGVLGWKIAPGLAGCVAYNADLLEDPKPVADCDGGEC